MAFTEDDGLRIATRQRIEDRRCFRKIELDPTARFPDWKEGDFPRKDTSTITTKARRACKAFKVGLKPEGSLLVIKANGPEKKPDAAIGIGRYLVQKVTRSQKFERPIKKEKHRTTFATLGNNLVSKKMFTDAKTARSHAFFRFTVAA
jgi:hypothetical protein